MQESPSSLPRGREGFGHGRGPLRLSPMLTSMKSINFWSTREMLLIEISHHQSSGGMRDPMVLRGHSWGISRHQWSESIRSIPAEF